MFWMLRVRGLRFPIGRCGLLIFSLAAALPGLCLAKDMDGACASKGAHAVVTSVDERLELTLADRRVLRVTGVEPPGPTPSDPELGTKARDWLADWLQNQDIVFQLSDSHADRWGRYAAAVFAPRSAADLTVISVAERLLEQGFARKMPDQYKIACEDRLLQAEKAARDAKRGLWDDPYYGVVAATDAAAFAEHAGSFILAEGKLADVRDFSTRTELLFGPHRHGTLAVTILQRNVKIFEAAGLHFRDLIGQTLRVRGLLETRFGPEIELTHPSDLELVAKGLDETVKPAQKAPALAQP
jgi:endonuclease YncB( thermonuclease family)